MGIALNLQSHPGPLSSLKSMDATGRHMTLMEKYIYTIFCSWILADAAIAVWLLVADKSAIVVEVGLASKLA